MSEDKKLEFFGHQIYSFVPFLIFIIFVAGLSLNNLFSMDAMIAGGVMGLIVGTFFAKDWIKYWDTAIMGIKDSAAGMVILIFFVAGIFGKVMGASGLADGFVWLGYTINLTGASFVVFTFIASGAFGVSTGTSVGTIVTLTPVLYPAGIILGANPIFLTGAILSGAALGDNLAPVSDTTILSASSQPFSQKDGNADIGGVVRSRFKYSIIASAIAIILFAMFGGGGELIGGEQAAGLLASHSNPRALFMLVPIIFVIYFAVSGRGIFTALIAGIFSGSIIGLLTGLLSFSDFLRVENGNPVGIIPGGISGMYGAMLIFVTVMALLGILDAGGIVGAFIAWSKEHLAKTARGSELTMMIFTTIWNFLTAGVTTNVVAICGPINSEIGQIHGIHPYRRANITDAIANTFSYFMPWSAFILIFNGVAGGLLETYPFVTIPTPSSLFFAAFYPLVLWLVILVSILTGFGRKYEGTGGEAVSKEIYNSVTKAG